MRRRIGIDVGGTNTDAVLLEEDAVVGAVKTPTTPDVTTGITRALAGLVQRAPGAREAQAVMIGTTHFTNAVVQRRDLGRVAAVRIGLPSGASLPPFVDWPEDLANLVRAEVVMLEGRGDVFDVFFAGEDAGEGLEVGGLVIDQEEGGDGHGPAWGASAVPL